MSFIFKITTTTSPQSFVIPCVNNGTFNATVDYGDGTGSQTVTTYNDANLTHSFATAGQYTITIDGTFPNVRFNDNAASREALDEVVDLGNVGWVTLENAFRQCTNLTAFDGGTADTSNVTSMSLAFFNCSSLVTTDFSNFDVSSLTTTLQAFYSCTSLTSIDLSSFTSSSLDSMQQMFLNCTALTSIDISNLDTSTVTNLSTVFNNCSALTTIDVTNFNTSNVTNMQQTFSSCSSLTSLDVSNFDTSSVTSMQGLFYNCNSLTALDVTGFDTSSVTNMAQLFRDCSSLTSLDVTNFITSSVTNMSYMFHDCTSLTTLDVSNFNTSNVTSMREMFRSCASLTTLDVSNFNTSSVISMYQMFRICTNLITLDLSNFDTSNVTTMFYMFQGCTSLTTLDLSNFDTSSVISMTSVFYSCSSLTTLDLSSFDTSSVANMQDMFRSCSNLANLDVKHFDVSSVTDGTNFLNGANNALTTTQYDELLEAWAVQDVQPNVSWHFGDAQYTVETIADWYRPRGQSSLSIINNKLVSIADSTATFGAAQQIDNLIVGNVYSFEGKATCSNSQAAVYLRVSEHSSLSYNADLINLSNSGNVTANTSFTATATTLYVGTLSTGHVANDTITIDADIAVRLMDKDRSLKDNHIQVFGTVVKEPVATGAELMSYKFGGGGAYLKLLDNSLSDMGSVWSISVWKKQPVYQTWDFWLCMSPADGTSNHGASFGYRGDGNIRYGNGVQSIAVSSSVIAAQHGDDLWHMHTYTCDGTNSFAYIDGVLQGSANPLNLDFPTSSWSWFVNGEAGDVGNSWTMHDARAKSLALLRMSKVSLTSEQITKMYEDEKVLFEENAACTLYGTSNAVTALEQDEDNELLHAGTSQGRSVFKGLQRVSNTTDAVGTAISTAAGIVTEE